VVVAIELESEHAARSASSPSVGIAPAELAERANLRVPHTGVSAPALRRWLVDNDFAVERDGLLYPTELGLEIAGILAG
jgi:hypothetical protein